jgi:hypothetical protein
MNEAPDRTNSKRFEVKRSFRWLVPLVLGLLVVGLLITLAVIFLSVAGLTPGV